MARTSLTARTTFSAALVCLIMVVGCTQGTDATGPPALSQAVPAVQPVKVVDRIKGVYEIDYFLYEGYLPTTLAGAFSFPIQETRLLELTLNFHGKPGTANLTLVTQEFGSLADGSTGYLPGTRVVTTVDVSYVRNGPEVAFTTPFLPAGQTALGWMGAPWSLNDDDTGLYVTGLVWNTSGLGFQPAQCACAEIIFKRVSP
jgi:hypothetical protein